MRSDKLSCLPRFLRQFTRRKKAYGVGSARCSMGSTPHLCYGQLEEAGAGSIYIHRSCSYICQENCCRDRNAECGIFVPAVQTTELLPRESDTVLCCYLPQGMSNLHLNIDGSNNRWRLYKMATGPSRRTFLLRCKCTDELETAAFSSASLVRSSSMTDSEIMPLPRTKPPKLISSGIFSSM
jgi:hypothetical protein